MIVIMDELSVGTISCNILINGIYKVGEVDNAFEFCRDIIN